MFNTGLLRDRCLRIMASLATPCTGQAIEPGDLMGKAEPPPQRLSLPNILGSGLTAGASDDDPRGIAAYPQAGAQFGYCLGWTLLFFFILRGKVKLTVVSEHRKEWVIAILRAGDSFGEGCLAGQPLHMTSATALAESAIARIEK